MKIPVITSGQGQRVPILGFKKLEPDLRRRAVYEAMLKQPAKQARRKAKPRS